MRDLKGRFDLLSINTATFGYQTELDKTVDLLASHNIGGIAPWRREVEAFGVDKAARLIRDAGLEVTGYCRSSYFPAATKEERLAAVQDNIKALEDAATLGADCFVAVVGSITHENPSLEDVRQQTLESLIQLAGRARELQVPIALEPLHPMYVGDRSCLSSLSQAIEWCDIIDAEHPGSVGIAADVYHLWWDPDLDKQLTQAGSRLLAYHVSDWLVPTEDLLTDRGMMGDGVIQLPTIRNSVERAGYNGLIEVEIFSSKNWWKKSPAETLRTCMERFQTHV
ncbi:sugar phosphate isomerase/epimerase family protein [Nitrincola sp.]|uniref:sugar phosphate isomerase/epimerase family protein n=1 Tax=Nitrincola sp. TaxID=1926584 RepID=UPI003A938976